MLSSAEKYDPGSSELKEVVLQTIDGDEIVVSRRLLASESGYFRSLFYGSYSDSNSPLHRISLTSDEIFSVLEAVDQILHKQIPIWSLQHSVDLLCHTSFLQMDKLLPIIRENITKKAEVNNILMLYRLAYQRDMKLANDLWRILIGNFDKFCEADEHIKMTEDEFIEALNDENLNVSNRQENAVILNYLIKNADSRRVEQLADRMKETGDGSESYPVVRDRLPKEILISACGWIDGPTNRIEIYNPRNGKWRRVEWLEGDKLAYHTFGVQQGKLYFCGGMDGSQFSRAVNCFDLNTMKWIKHRDMVERRCYSASAMIRMPDGHESLMVLGGYNGESRLSSCELIDPPTTFTKIRSMSKQRSDCAATTLDGRVVAVGGFDGRSIHQDVEMLDLMTNVWRPVSRRMKGPRTGTATVNLNENVIFVAGGYDGTERLASVEFYDTREGSWHQLPWMRTARSNFSMEFMNGSVWVAGGFDGSVTTPTVECFDIVAQRWQNMPKMSVARSALKMARLTEHESIRELIAYEQ